MPHSLVKGKEGTRGHKFAPCFAFSCPQPQLCFSDRRRRRRTACPASAEPAPLNGVRSREREQLSPLALALSLSVRSYAQPERASTLSLPRISLATVMLHRNTTFCLERERVRQLGMAFGRGTAVRLLPPFLRRLRSQESRSFARRAHRPFVARFIACPSAANLFPCQFIFRSQLFLWSLAQSCQAL